MLALLLDIGNTRCKAVYYRHGELELLSDFAKATLTSLQIDVVLYATVASEQRVRDIQQYTGLLTVPWHEVYSEAVHDGLVNCYQNPETLGVDRWLAMLGAKQLWPQQDIVVIDAGTAITVDWVQANGQHLGGWILPGLRLMQKAVTGNTAKVSSDTERPGTVQPGQSTSECLQNGCFAAAVATIRSALDYRQGCQIVFTGGDAAELIKHLPINRPIHLEPLLVFHGLVLYLPIRP